MRKNLLKIMILSALSAGFCLHSFPASAASSADIPLQWYTFEVTTEDSPPVEESKDIPEKKQPRVAASEPSGTFKERIQSILDEEEPDETPEGKNLPEVNPELKSAAVTPQGSIEEQIAALKERRRDEDKLLADLLRKQKQEQEQRRREEALQARERAEREKAVQAAANASTQKKAADDKNLLKILGDMKEQQSTALAAQNQQLLALMETIKVQQEQIKNQQTQLADLQKYKETMVIQPPSAVGSEASVYQPPSDATVFEYMPGSTYQIYCRPGFETDVQLRHDEEVVSVIAGDPSRWSLRVVPGAIGSHIYIRPVQLGLETNAIVTTNQRSYQVYLRAAQEFNPIVSWTYPLDPDVPDRENFKNEAVPVEVESVNQLSFAYKVSKKYKWRPDFVFHDGFRTYIHMPTKALRKAPVIFVKDRDGLLTLVNYTVKNGNYIVDRLIDDAELRIDDQVVQIRRER